MSQKNLYCDQCGSEATVFALQPPAKIKACAQHVSDLMGKYSSVFVIAAYDFIERTEDYAEYEERRNSSQKCLGVLTTLKERCERNRHEAYSRLQIAKEGMQTVLDRSFTELQIRVEQRFAQVMKELEGFSAQLERYIGDKSCTPCLALAALQAIPSGALFRVCVGESSLLIAKAVTESGLLLPLKGEIPRENTGEQIAAMTKDMAERADLAEEIGAYALELGYQGPNIDFKAAVSKKKQKIAQGLLLALPYTATEQQLRDTVQFCLQQGVESKEKGEYAKSLRKLEKGWGLLQYWGLESAEMCLEIGAIYAHFGRRDEACIMLNRGLLHSSSPELSLKLNRSLVEIFYQKGEWEETIEAAELALASAGEPLDSFETLQIVFFLTNSHYNLGGKGKGFTLVDYWTSRVVADSPSSQAALLLISASKKNQEGSKKEAGLLYEEGLKVFPQAAGTYLGAMAQFRLGVIYETLQQQDKAITAYLKAIASFSAHFPLTLHYAICLACLGDLYKSMKNENSAETIYLQAISLYSAHFPKYINHAHSLYSLGSLLKNKGRKAEAIPRLEAALQIYLESNSHKDVTDCLSLLEQLGK